MVAVLDSNSSTDGIDFPIPGNDDASRAISFYCDLVSRTILDGMESQLGSAGIDLGEAEMPVVEELSEEKIQEQKPKEKIDGDNEQSATVDEPNNAERTEDNFASQESLIEEDKKSEK